MKKLVVHLSEKATKPKDVSFGDLIIVIDEKHRIDIAFEVYLDLYHETDRDLKAMSFMVCSGIPTLVP